jgi:hypothetical protein
MKKRQNKRYVNIDYLKFVKNEKCVFSKDFNHQSKACSGLVEVHHLLKPWIGPRGMSLKSDDRNCCPLCVTHHRQLHNLGSEKALCVEHNKDEKYLQWFAENLWKIYIELPDDDGLPF